MPRCLDVYSCLTEQQKISLYCEHLQRYHHAYEDSKYADKKVIDVSSVKDYLLDEDYQLLVDSSVNGSGKELISNK